MPSGARAALDWSRYRPLDLFATAVAVLLPVAISPDVASYTFTPKVAVLLLVLGVGAPVLVQLAVRSEVQLAARAALAFLAVGLVSSLVSKSITVGIFGLYSWGTGWLFWCGVTAAWAIGTQLSGAGRRLLVGALVTGAVVNALVALVQLTVQPSSPAFGLYDGTQADGLMGNPIYLESLLLGAVAILVELGRREPRFELRTAWPRLALVAVLAAALEASGERFGLALLALLCVYTVLRSRTVAAVAYVAAALVAYGATYGASSTIRSRLTTLSVVTSNPRTLIWRTGAYFLEHHVLLGAGPGELVSALTSVGSLALTRRLGVGVDVADAHDLVVQVAVTTGLLGLACFLVWGGTAARGVRGPLLAFALFAAAVELVEPLNVAVTPLVFLALGAARTLAAEAPPARAPAWSVLGRGVLVACALAAACLVVAGDVETHDGLEQYDYGAAAAGARLLGVWYDPAAIAGEVAANHGIRVGDASSAAARTWFARAVEWRQRAVQRFPTNPAPWVELGDAELELGRDAAARQDFLTALDQDPWATDVLQALGALAMRQRDWDSAVHWLSLALRSAPGDRTVTRQLAAARAHRA